MENLNFGNFDWDAYEAAARGTKNEEEIAKFDGSLNAIKESEVVEGTVVSVDKREVVVNVGFKTNGIIAASEFRYNPELKVGDKVDVCIQSQEDMNGQLVISHKEARAFKAWDRVNEAYEKEEIVQGYIKCRTQGGMTVDVLGMEAYLPSSQIDVKPIHDYDIFVGKTMEFMIVKINPDFRNVVVSHRVLIEAELEAQKKEIVGKLEIGQVLEGTVKNITSYGVFIDIGGVDGLIHITDLDWVHVNNPKEIVQLGQKINVIILGFNEDRSRISLGLKQLTPQPWNIFKKTHTIGQEMIVSIKRVEDYGVLIWGDQREGLLHKTDMFDYEESNLRSFVEVGQKLVVIISKIDDDKRKFSVRMKSPFTDPWKNIDVNMVGSIVQGRVMNIVDYGLFVQIAPGIVGLLHVNELPLEKRNKPLHEIFHEGMEIETVVLDVNLSAKRITLGMKQIIAAEMQEFAKTIQGSKQVEVTKLDEKNNVVEVSYEDKLGIIPKSQLSINKVIKLQDEVFVGEELTAYCIGSDDQGRLVFSLKDSDEDVYDSSLYEMSLEQLLATMGISTNLFVAKANKYVDNQILFTDISVVDGENADRGRLLVDPITGKNKFVSVTEKWASLYTPGAYYQLTLGLANKKYRRRSHDPYVFTVDTNSEAIPNPYKEAVELAYTKHTSPDTNQSVARLLDEVGENLYSSKKRMFFELLQNADDSSATDGVRFNVETTDEYLIVTHNGFSFNIEDFESIISAAKSTKRANQKKTGYKGIGFKSVFTGTQKVLIKTGGLFFSFDSQHDEFNNFEDFYFKVNGLKSDEEKQLFLKKFRTNKSSFRGVRDVPWQLLPIWEENIPQELMATSFKTAGANVAIAIKKSEIDIAETCKSISEVLAEPLFLLFLRNTRRVQLSLGDKIMTVQKVSTKGRTEIVSSQNPHVKSLFAVETMDDIPVSDNGFAACNIPIRKNQELVPGQDEKEDIFEQFDRESGSYKKVEVPSRIAAATQSAISYAVALDQEGHVCPIVEENINSLFAYLPMNEMTYRFRFYINADFIPTSDREGVQTNNPWNWYIFYQIGRNLPQWVARYASVDNSEYLNLLQDHLFAEDVLSAHFNRGYLEAIEGTPFIMSEEGELVSQDKILIDKSGLSNIIGSTLFRQILNSNRHLPAANLNTNILEKSKKGEDDKLFDKIEIVRTKYVSSKLLNNDLIKDWLKSSDKTSRLAFFAWILENRDACENLVSYLPLFKCGTEILTLTELNGRQDCILLTDTIAPLKDILTKLGFTCTDESVEEHPLCGLIAVPSEKSVFDKINAKSPFAELTPSEKRELIIRLFSFDGVGEATIKSMLIFHNHLGELTPMSQLIHTEKSYLANFAINEEEYDEEIEDFLISDSEVYDKLLNSTHRAKIITDNNVVQIYTDYHDYWREPFWKELVNSMSSDTMLPIMQYANPEIVKEFLKRVPEIHLDSSSYSEQDFEYNVYQLANNTQNNAILLNKTYIGDDLVSRYTIKNDVTIIVDRESYCLSLSEILPLRKTHITEMFLQRLPFVSIDLTELDKEQIANEIFENLTNTGNTISVAQFIFICLWNRSRNVISYAPCRDDQVACMNSHAIDCLEYCFTHNIRKNLSQFKRSGVVDWNISDKYFDISNVLLEDEKLSHEIQKWADSPEKVQFLYELGVKRSDSNIIKNRIAFWNGDEYDDAIIFERNTFQWIASISGEKLAADAQKRDNRIKLLKRMLVECRLTHERRTADLCRAEANEWTGNSAYQVWKNDRGLRIFICPRGVPYELYYGEYTFCVLYNNRHFIYNKDIFISGLLEIQDAMTDAIGQTFTREDWHFLFSVSSIEFKSLQDKYDNLLEKYQNLLQIHDSYDHAGMGAGDDNALSEQQMIEAQREAQEYLKWMKTDWIFPDGYGELNEDGKLRHFSTSTVRDGNGKEMLIVLKSYKYQSEPFKINPQEWDYIAKHEAHLFIYTGSDVVEITLEDIIRNQTNIRLTFSTENFEVEDKIQQFSDILHYFNSIHFDFESFNITKKAKSIRNMYNKHEGSQNTTGDDDL